MCWGPSAAFSTCVTPRLSNRGLFWAVALWSSNSRNVALSFFSSLVAKLWKHMTDWLKCTFLYLSNRSAKYAACCAATVSQSDQHIVARPTPPRKWECHLRISDVEVGPNLVDSSRGASVPQQKAEQIAGGRCLILWLLLWAHIGIVHCRCRCVIITTSAFGSTHR